MFKKISLPVLFVIVAMSATACAPQGFQLPTSLPQFPTDTQPSVAPVTSSNSQPDQSAQSAPPTPGAGPQAGLNGKGGKVRRGVAALLQLLNRLGWEGGIITKISDNQIALRIIERPPFLGTPGPNQPNPNQPGQNRKDQGRIDAVTVNSSTIIIVPGKNNATLNDLHVGDRVVADVPNGQKFAALVMGTPKEIDKDNVTLGMVTSNSNGSITLRTPGGGDTITTNATTQVFKLTRDGVSAGSVSDLQNGNLVFALGNGNKDNFMAQVIFALPKGALELRKGSGNGKKNFQPQQQTTPNSGG